jgi:hypothetical protein
MQASELSNFENELIAPVKEIEDAGHLFYLFNKRIYQIKLSVFHCNHKNAIDFAINDYFPTFLSIRNE